MQEHEYKARDKTVQKMSRDGLREKNLRSKKEKRITGREADEKKTAGHREQELDFGKVRKTHTAEETVEEVTEGKHRLQSRHAFLEQEEIAEAEEMENSEMSDDKAGGEKSPSVSRSRLRKESIRGHPERKFERDSEITETDRQNRKKKMVTAYAAKEQKRYHEKSEVDEKSMEDFREEIKGKTKREQIRKEQKKSKSRLSFEDESKGVIPGSGMAKRGASAVSETVSDYGQKKVREDTDDNAALDAAGQMELAGESLARKSVYVRERLKENRQRNNRLRESVLEETEKFRLQFGTSASDEAKRAVQKEAEQKKQSALKKLLQKKRYQKQYQAAKQGKAVKDAVLVNAQRFTEKAKAAVKELVAQNRNILLSIGVLVLLFALMATSLSSCAALFQGSSNAIALHHLDCPWKPSDLEQQEGRILRQGNQNDKVKIFRYVTENTFDSYMWQILENKQKFISQIMTSKSPVRACEDVDDTALSYAEIKALATGNEYIKEKMDLDVQVSKLKLLKANHTSQIYRLESDIAKRYPVQITALKEKIAGMRVDADVVKGIDLQDNDHFAMTVGGKLYTDKKEAGVALISAASGLKSVKSAGQIGEYHGFALSSEYNFLSNTYTMTLKGKCSYKIEFGKDTLGNIQRIHNALSAIEKKLADTEQNLETVQQQLKTAQEEVQKPFPKEAELSEKMERLAELNAMLNMDEKGGENLLADEGIGENPEVNVPEERQDRIADSVHKTSVLERLKEQKQQAGETHQKPKKKHEQEL